MPTELETLQDALKQWDSETAVVPTDADIGLIVDAARRVANPDYDRISQAAEAYAKRWGYNPNVVANIMHEGAALALGITEDNDVEVTTFTVEEVDAALGITDNTE